MKQLQNNFTTPEQSKKLLEWGLPADSADCIFALYEGQTKRSILNDAMPTFSSFIEQIGATNSVYAINAKEEYLPCWSAGRLIEIWQRCVGSDILIYSDDILVEKLIDELETANGRYELDFSKLEE